MLAFVAIINGILAELQLTRKGNYKDPVEEAKAFIDKHLAEDVSLEEVAKRVGLARTYFSALFKKMTGKPSYTTGSEEEWRKRADFLPYLP